MSVSIIIPAHNEEAVIRRLLREAIKLRDCEVIVVANGCCDRTAAVCSAMGARVRVIETPVGSKTHALNLGDAAAAFKARVYIDADILITAEDLQKVVDAVQPGGSLAASPMVAYDFDGVGWGVRAFYDIDDRLPSSGGSIGTSGVYALSAEGRGRFGSFPALTADDGFVRRHFSRAERAIVADAVAVVRPPETVAGLIGIKTRSHYGNYELDATYPQLTSNIGHRNGPVLASLAMRPWLWGKLAVYGWVKVRAKSRARRQWRSKAAYVWERDDSSRKSDDAPPVAGSLEVAKIAPRS